MKTESFFSLREGYNDRNKSIKEVKTKLYGPQSTFQSLNWSKRGVGVGGTMESRITGFCLPQRSTDENLIKVWTMS